MESLLGSECITREQGQSRQKQPCEHLTPGLFQRNSIQAFLHGGEGAQVKNLRSGALGCLMLSPSPSLPGHCSQGHHSTALAGHSTWEYSWNQLWAQTALWEIRVLGLFLHLPAPAARRQVPRCDVTVMEHRLETFPGSWSHQLHPADCQDQEAGWRQPSCGKISQNGAVFTGDILCF